MLALVLAILFCVAVGLGIVGYVLVEARREGRGEFWTAEGEELLAGARRTTEKVRHRGEQLGRTAAGRTRDLAGRLPEMGAERRSSGEHLTGAELAGDEPQADTTVGAEPEGQDGYRAAS